ncbi:2,4-dichlorophenol 6-monooxygenase [Paecilomyces variotii]|uniref:2,4-dichlorophenol 6-monooxygenase n=1 Tax=Byssochlamys spectabilis TaxID=264951 RepID=A0A443HX03_BYSSP|nr:2,4-dichlorophenol 6-monooxygenase [Paecilomyces variotii]KAJ9218592.1 hypothetical protein DTO169C6_9055 [Paecilomyces variotii]KAJ9231503.1 hypothetical protein DTO169E5_7969 [Paecilomyces variotii]KAJ9252625.1 hypothetical protein DTO207G8_4687 [Paecilomyces variotii]KAJ9284033.1 hypothetical protein DTO021C3_8371 [Paecilomyces variotii]KAJ9327634.1 hypothetical protein DTO027B3_1856 [Paecilomyces variotii]
MSQTVYPVAIIGGGPVGLATSISLSSRDIPHVLFERYYSTSIHPKAVGLNQRSVEFFRSLGIEEDVKRIRAPADSFRSTAWYTSLGPDGRQIFKRNECGGGRYAEEYKRASPCDYTILPQIRLEPILHKRAKELNPEGIINGATVVGIEEGNDAVKLRVRYGRNQIDGGDDEGKEESVEARYVVAADGGKMAAEALGIKMEGERDIVDMVSAHIRAPISRYHPDPDVLISWFIDPSLGGSISTGFLYHVGPYPMEPNTEEWMFACALNPSDPQKFGTEDMIKRIHRTLKIPKLEIELKSVSHWFVNSIVAERFRSRGGRVFLAGDTAHRIPPWGALGLNTGLQDVQNLAWKLAMAVKTSKSEEGKYDALLNSYEEERRPIALRVAHSSLTNLRNHSLVMDRALGILPDAAPEDNIKSVAAFLDKADPGGDKLRDAVEKAQEILDTEFHAPGAEIGWFYPSLDIYGEGAKSHHGGQTTERGDMVVTEYFPSALPGHHVPHAWLKRGAKQISTWDLLDTEKCVLISMAEEPWTELHSDLVKIETIEPTADLDMDRDWFRLCGIDSSGAVLVRPDGIVLWRCKDAGNVSEIASSEIFDDLIRHLLKLPARERHEASSI